MKIRKVTIAGAALLASLAFVAGCQGSGSGGSAEGGTTTTAPSMSAAEELTAAAKKLGTTSYTYTVNAGPAKVDGAADPANKAVMMKMDASQQGATLKIDVIAIGTDYYLKIAGLPLPGIDPSKYLHLDGTKVKSLQNFGIDNLNDPTNAEKLSDQLATVEKTGEGKFKGTLDLTKASAAAVDNATVKALGDKAKALPFEATVDSQGRLTTFTFTVPATGSTPEMPIETTYSNFGSGTAIAKPAANQVVEAPENIYSMFGS